MITGRLITGGQEDPLLPHLIEHLSSASSVDIATAFAFSRGVGLIEKHLEDLLKRGGQARILVGDYLSATEPDALIRLLDLADGERRIEFKIFQSGGTSFHPKAYIFSGPEERISAFVGSSNLSEMALTKGVEWNYLISRETPGPHLAKIVDAFQHLWEHEQTHPLDHDWIDEYAKTREPPSPKHSGMVPEHEAPITPNSLQEQALQALEETRSNGFTAGLVVLPTGSGKTWLSALDTNRPEYPRILFVAHREEILNQSRDTFRKIRPSANLGLYTGKERNPGAEVIFASIQTLKNKPRRERFDAREFDYIVIDEFHHAAAKSYRKVLDYFEPKFLLGLTATPDRTDRQDLLALCDNNLIYSADLNDGIREGVLCPFEYFGVPDIVNYDNIPWRNNKWPTEELTNHVATVARAENAYEQLKKYAKEGYRALAFCVSQRHADFMANFFQERGLRSVSVHAGESSAPRTQSVEQLKNGEIDVLCSVDIFNEGVDLPSLDTILMLRPTESRILWLQQFGRGLRVHEEKKLSVIDYIGNHRTFLTKTQMLLNLGQAHGDLDIAMALQAYSAGEIEFPPGCSVTYDLEAIEILKALTKPKPAVQAIQDYYEEYRETYGRRPLAYQAFQDGYNPLSLRRAHQGTWFSLVESMGDLTENEDAALKIIGPFLEHLETTVMVKSYKMLVLKTMLAQDSLPGNMDLDQLSEGVARQARRYSTVRSEMDATLDDPDKMRRLVRDNPVKAWAGGAGTGGDPYFKFEKGVFSTGFTVPENLRSVVHDMTYELVEWRLQQYLHRSPHAQGPDRFSCRLTRNTSGNPIIILPDRNKILGIPKGWCDVYVDGVLRQMKFVKIAVNVMVTPGSTDNILPELLRSWFGERAGAPGNTHSVQFDRYEQGYRVSPVEAGSIDTEKVIPWNTYTREQAFDLFDLKVRGAFDMQVGILQRSDKMLLFVTLEKKDMDATYQYNDQFLSEDTFQWESQNRNTQESSVGQDLKNPKLPKHLFVRRTAKIRSRTQPFRYAGELNFERWEGEKPIKVWWKLETPVPTRLREEMGLGD